MIRKERVVAGWGGEQPFGQAEDDDKVEVEANTHADGPDQDAFAHPPDPTEVGLELELQGAGKHDEIDRFFDGIEAGQSVQGQVDPLGRLLLRHRPGGPPAFIAKQLQEMATGPVGSL